MRSDSIPQKTLSDGGINWPYSKGKIPSTGSWEGDLTHNAASCRTASPITLPTELFRPQPATLHHAGQQAHHTTNWAIQAPTRHAASCRTASPSHYQLSYSGPNPRHCIMQDSKPITLPTELFRPQPATLHHAGQQAHHTTDQAIPAPTRDTASCRTASPSHYWPSYSGPNPRHCIMQDSKPITLPTELFRPQPATLHHAGQQAHHTTNWAIPAPTRDAASRRTASPSHYQLSYSGPNPRRCITQDSKPITLPTELFRPQPATLHHAGQQAHHTTNWAIPAPTRDAASCRTASLSHYQLSYSGPNPRRCIMQDSKPITLPTELFRPQPAMLHHAVQQAHHTTDWAIQAPTRDAASRSTASPSHYQLSYSGPNPWRCITQDSKPITLPTELFRPQTATLHHAGQRAQHTNTLFQSPL